MPSTTRRKEVENREGSHQKQENNSKVEFRSGRSRVEPSGLLKLHLTTRYALAHSIL
jgi:hypothetical protein